MYSTTMLSAFFLSLSLHDNEGNVVALTKMSYSCSIFGANVLVQDPPALSSLYAL